jgi:hypothetical protein
MSKRKIWGRCRLCLSDDWLVDSDIIPKFHYKPLREGEGRFYVLSTDPSKRVEKRRKGAEPSIDTTSPFFAPALWSKHLEECHY